MLSIPITAPARPSIIVALQFVDGDVLIWSALTRLMDGSSAGQYSSLLEAHSVTNNACSRCTDSIHSSIPKRPPADAWSCTLKRYRTVGEVWSLILWLYVCCSVGRSDCQSGVAVAVLLQICATPESCVLMLSADWGKSFPAIEPKSAILSNMLHRIDSRPYEQLSHLPSASTPASSEFSLFPILKDFADQHVNSKGVKAV